MKVLFELALALALTNIVFKFPCSNKCSPSISWADFLTVLKLEKKMAAGRVAHVTLKGPSVVKEILTGMGVALFAGSFWKMHQWNEQRKVRAFYDLLEKGEIGVVVDEE